MVRNYAAAGPIDTRLNPRRFANWRQGSRSGGSSNLISRVPGALGSWSFYHPEQRSHANLCNFILPSVCYVLAPLEGIAIAFARSDAQRMIDRYHEDLAVADLAGLRGFRDDLDGLVRDFVRDGRLNSKLGHVLLAAIAFDLGDRHAIDSGDRERFAHCVELEWLDDGRNELHEEIPARMRSTREAYAKKDGSTTRQMLKAQPRCAGCR